MTCTLLAKHAPSSLVAFGARGERSAAELWRDAGQVAAALPPARAGSCVLLCVNGDRYAFGAGLLAAIARGHEIALAPVDADRGAFLRLAQHPEVVAVVHDTFSSAALRVDRLLEQPATASPLSAAALVADPLLHLHVARDSDAPHTYRRRCSQLLREAESLNQLLALGAGTRLAASVLPGDGYGLLFGVLCPLLGGAAFLRERPQPGPELRATLQRERADVLITVPAHLHRILTEHATDSAPQLQRVVSSRAPLPLATARRACAQLGAAVLDVYGTSVTGSLGSRDGASEHGFTPLREVQLSANASSELAVHSPWLALEAEPAYQSAERVRFSEDGSFRVYGRAGAQLADCTSELTLAQLEAELGCMPGVRDACLVRVSGDGGQNTALPLTAASVGADDSPLAAAPAAKPQLLAAVEIDPQLLAAVAIAPQRLAAVEIDRRLAGELRETLHARFGAGAVPDRFLFMSLPRGGGGRHDLVRVLRAFGRKPDASPLCFELEFAEAARSERDGEARWVYQVHVPANYVYFEGHFPGYPILPGAAQLSDVVLPCVRRARPELGALTQMTRLKFSERIKPDDRIEVQLQWRAAEPAVEFALRRASTVCATGRLTFTGPGGGA